MTPFADQFELKFGDCVLRGRRLTLKEIREHHADFFGGQQPTIDACLDIIRKHVTRSDGAEFDPEDLTPRQVRELIGELVLPDGGRGISDFIGLLSV